MEIKFTGEFSYEIALVIPYAYYLYVNGLLKRTVSSKGTKSLYFFSKNHRESWIRRKDPGTRPIPGNNQTLYTKMIDFSKWKLPPYKKHFKNKKFIYNKPIFIIHNKYSGYGKKNKQILTKDRFDIIFLKKIFNILKDKYQIIYIRPNGKEKGFVNDKNKIIEFNDLDMIKKEFNDIITIQDLLNENSDLNYNDIQLMLHANCDISMSTMSGASMLALLYGGTHFIYQKTTRHFVKDGSYENSYLEKMSGTKIYFSNDYDILYDKIKRYN